MRFFTEWNWRRETGGGISNFQWAKSAQCSALSLGSCPGEGGTESTCALWPAETEGSWCWILEGAAPAYSCVDSKVGSLGL